MQRIGNAPAAGYSFLLLRLALFFVVIPGRLAAHQPHDPIATLALSPNYASDQTIFIATGYLTTSLGSFAALKSTDGGVNWAVMTGLPNAQSTAIQFSPSYSQDGIAFIGNVKGLYRTTSRGNAWSAVGGTLGIVRSIAVSPNFANDGTLYILNNGGGVYVSNNQGNTFTPIKVPVNNFFQIAISPNFKVDHTLIAGARTGGIYRSASNGQSWLAATTTSTTTVTSVTFSPAYAFDSTVFVTTFGGGIMISTDGGNTWALSNTNLTDLNATDLALSPNFVKDGTLYVTTAAGGVFKSNNRGGAWSLLPAPHRNLSGQTTLHFDSIAVANTPPANQILFLGMYEGLWDLEFPAMSWTYNDILPTRLVRSLQVSPNYPHDHFVVASTYGGGVVWSHDGAGTWQFQNSALPNSYPDPVAISPNFAADGTVLSGIVNGLLSSSSPGSSWSSVSMLGTPVFPRAIAMTPTFAQDSTVFIGIDNRDTGNPTTVSYLGQQIPTQGLFVSADRGNTWAPAGLPGVAIDAIVISSGYASDNTIYVGSSTQGLYKSTDRGNSWSSVAIFANSPVPTIALSPQFPTDQTIFVGTSAGIFKAVDGGTNWTLLPASVNVGAVGIVLSPNFVADQTLFVATLSNGLLKSVDGGNSFVTAALPDNYVSAVAVSPGFAQDNTVLAAAYSGIFKSADGGSTWSYTAEPAREEEIRVGLLYQGGWSYVPNTAIASTEAFSVAIQQGASLTLSFVGSGIRWIGSTGPNYSSASVILDGAPAGSGSANSTQTLWQQVLWSQTGLSCGPHTLSLSAVLGANGSTGVPVDAFDIFRDSTCVAGGAAAFKTH